MIKYMDIMDELKVDFCDIILPRISEDKVQIGNINTFTIPRFNSVSGKGSSFIPDYQNYTNITLLEHSVNVAFTAMHFALLDYLSQDKDLLYIKQHLSVILTVGMLHDTNKLVCSDEKIPTNISDFFTSYGFSELLLKNGVNDLTGNVIAGMIGLVEAGTSGQTYSDYNMATIRKYEKSIKYVSIGDKIDSIFNKYGIHESIDKVNALFHVEQNVNNFILLDKVKYLKLNEKLFPYTIMATALSMEVWYKNHYGTPPLINMFSDGEWIISYPEKDENTFKEQVIYTLKKLVSKSVQKQFGVKIGKGNNALSILNGYADLNFMGNLVEDDELPETLKYPCYKAKDISNEMWEVLERINNSYSTSFEFVRNAKGEKKIIPLVQYNENNRNQDILRTFAQFYISCEISRNNVEIYKRIQSLLMEQIYNFEVSEIIQSLKTQYDGAKNVKEKELRFTLNTLISYFSVQEAYKNGTIDILKNNILNTFIDGRFGEDPKGVNIEEMVSQYYSSRVIGDVCYMPIDDMKGNRCLFTDLPISKGQSRLNSNDGVNIVKITAFNSRQNSKRTSGNGDIYVNPLMKAELFIQQKYGADTRVKGKSQGNPVIIMTPLKMGVGNFNILNRNNSLDAIINTFSVYDILKHDDTCDVLLRTSEKPFIYKQSIVVPKRFEDILSLFEMTLKAALRSGKPVHLFCGQVIHSKDFFYMDGLPSGIYHLMNNKGGIRLDEIPSTLDRICVVTALLNAKKYNMAHRIFSHDDYLKNLSIAYFNLAKVGGGKKYTKVLSYLKDLIKQEIISMKERHEEVPALYKLAKLSNLIQASYSGSNNVEASLLRWSIDCLSQSRDLINNTNHTYLIEKICGNILKKGGSLTMFFASKERRPSDVQLSDVVANFASIFVNEFFFKKCKGKIPHGNKKVDSISEYCAYRQINAKTVFREKSNTDNIVTLEIV